MSGAILLLEIISIGFSAHATVSSRTAEFGLRQALGAPPLAVAVQVVAENTVLAVIGGIVGAYLGTAGVIIVSLVNRWAPVLDLPLMLATVAGCALLGGLAGCHRRSEPRDLIRWKPWDGEPRGASRQLGD